MRRSCIVSSLAVAIILLIALSREARAATRTWSGAGNTWNSTGNWSGGVVPASGDSLVFRAAGTGGTNLNDDLTGGTFNIAGIKFTSAAPAYVIGNGDANPNAGNAFTLTGSLTNSSTNLQTINDPFSLSGTQTFTTALSGGNLTLGGVISGTGGITLPGPGVVTLTASNTYTGNTTINGGTLAVVGGVLGGGNYAASMVDGYCFMIDTSANQTFSGVISGAGGLFVQAGSGVTTLAANNTWTGGTTVSGGTLNVTGSINSSGNGLEIVDGGGTFALSGSLVCQILEVGDSASGTFTQSGGINTIQDWLFVGTLPGGSGAYTLGGGSLAEQMAYLGTQGSSTGSFTQTGGTHAVSADAYLGYYAGANGTYNLGGGLLSTPFEAVGYAGTGTFTQTGGSHTVGTLVIGSSSGSSGAYNFNGGLLNVSNLSGGGGSAAFNFNGGTLQAGGAFSSSLSMTLGGSATFDTAGYAVTLSGPLSGSGGLTEVGSGVLTLNATDTYSGNTSIGGGTLALGSGLALQRSTLDTSGTGTLSFTNLTAGTLGGLQGNGNLALSNTALAAVALSVGNNNASTTFSGQLSGGGSFIKVGSGALDLVGAETYSGTTAVSQGELFVNGSMASSIAVHNGGLLGGSGSLASATVTSGGTLAPGYPLGAMQLSGSLSLLSGAVMDYDLDTPTDSSQVLMSGGTLVLAGQQFSDFDFTPLAGYGRGTYDLIDAGTIVGSLGQNTSGTINGLPASLALQDNDLVLNIVPEPGTLWLLTAAAALGLLRWAWQKRKRINSAADR